MLNFEKETGARYELSLVKRDADGNPTGRVKFITDDAAKLSQHYLRHRGKPKKKVKVDPNAPTTTKVVKAYDNVQAYVETSEKDVVDIVEWNRELDELEKQQNRK